MFNFFKKSSKEILISAPFDGEIFPLSSSPDPAFAEGMMGEGLCIDPSSNIIYAPFECDVDIFHTLHAIGCTNGTIEAIVHVGMNTVSLQGEGFTALAPLQGKVDISTPLVSFDRGALLKKVDTLISPIVIVEKPTNAVLEIVKLSGTVKSGETIMKIIL